MSATLSRGFVARLDALAEVAAFVEAFGAAQGVAPDDRLRLLLVVEELFTNGVVHGHGGGSDRHIVIALQSDAACIRLQYEDDAPPFDPLAARERVAAAVDAPADERQVGGLGIHLVLQLARHVAYERAQGCNRLVVELARRG